MIKELTRPTKHEQHQTWAFLSSTTTLHYPTLKLWLCNIVCTVHMPYDNTMTPYDAQYRCPVPGVG